MFEALIPPGWAARITGLDPAEFWLGTGFLLLLSAAAFYFIFRSLQRARFIEDTPTSRVRSAAQGYVELDGIGYLMPGPPIVAPLTGISCTWYSITIEERVESSDGRGGRTSSWRTRRREVSDSLFLLRDETGDCIIDPDGAEVTPAITEVWYGDDLEWSIRTLRPSGLLAGGRYRYTEKRMHPGDALYAIGQFRTVGGSQELPDTHAEVRELLAEWKRDQVRLHERFDTDKNGLLSQEEWEQVRRTAWQEVLQAQARRARGPAHNIMTRPDDRRPYLLSVLPQGLLVRRYRIMAAVALVLFLGSGGVATWLLSVRFGQ